MAVINGTTGNDTLNGSTTDDTISGLAGNDTLWANSGNDSAMGGAGNDLVDGDTGTDWIEGGIGNDTLNGGGGQDHYVFREAGAANADSLSGFASDWDDLQFDLAGFSALGAAGRFSAADGRFWSAAGATAGHDADDRLIYNTSTGQLFYDADGNGAGTAQLVATQAAGTALRAADIWVFGSATPPGGGGATAGNDTLTGTAGNDSLDGLAGNDSISGLEGNDSLAGSDGNDTLIGGGGLDTLNGGLGNDTYVMSGSDGSDDTIIDAGGIDTVVTTMDWQLGTGMENLVFQAPAYNTGYNLTGNELDNIITVESGSATPGMRINGGAGNDSLIGGNGWNTYVFNAGNFGNDTIEGSPIGTDVADFTLTTAALTVDLRAGTYTSAGGSGALRNVDRVWGGSGADRLTASDAATWFEGGGGNDTLIGGAGNDSLFGMGSGSFINGGSDSLSGGAGNDNLQGNNGGNDTIDGGTGNDTLNGWWGADTLTGGLGRDTVTGGEDADRFVFREVGSANADALQDFTSGSDKLALDATVMTALGNSGTFVAGDERFYSAAGASAGHDADDRVVFNTTTRELFYDADGNGAGAAQLIATIQSGGTVVAGDIVVDNGTPPPPSDAPPPGSIVGSNGNDFMGGTAGNDTIYSLDGNDTVWANSGNDSVVGGAGNDYLGGENGTDWLEGGAGNDTLDGGSGQDHYVFREAGAANADSLSGFGSDWDDLQFDIAGFSALGSVGRFAAGDGRFWSAAGATAGHDADDRIIYNTTTGQLFYDADGNGAGTAQLVATQAAGGEDIVATDISVFGTATPPGGGSSGTAGNDTLTGTSGNDTLDGLGGNDSISGLAGNDSLVGGDGDDTLDGGTGADTLNGGLGSDTYYVGAGEGDVIVDAGGIDTLVLTGSNMGGARLPDGIENLTVRGSFMPEPQVDGNALDNVIRIEASGFSFVYGNGGNDTLIGGGSSEAFFVGLTGNSVVDGGGGSDRLSVGNDAVTIDFRTGIATGAASPGRITFSNIELANGGGSNDLLIAGDTGVTLAGADGNDTLRGGSGNDVLNADEDLSDRAMTWAGTDLLIGGGGNDILKGGYGADHFVFDQAAGAANADQIWDFETGVDKLDLDAAAMTALGASGNFAAGDARFWAAAGATAGHDVGSPGTELEFAL